MDVVRHRGMISDTPPAIKRILFAGYRRMSAIEKFDRVRELNQLLEALALSDIRSKHPTATDREQRLYAVARRLPEEVFHHVLNIAFTEQTPMSTDPLRVVSRLAGIFEELGLIYWLGGSMASAVYGEFRATQDVDFVAELRHEHIPLLVAACGDDFYLDSDMIADAIATQSSFNLIHLATMYKADVFIMQQTAWANAEKARRQKKQMRFEEEIVSVYVASAEDMILQKLAWYRLGGGVSDRQWSDVQGMLGAQADTLDYQYLNRWAEDLNLTDLLRQAYEDAVIEARYLSP
jgi:hypothetical protein